MRTALSPLSVLGVPSPGGGGASGGVAPRFGGLLPFLAGTYPVWHHAETTPDADGVVTAMTDTSAGLYPLTISGEPVRGSSLITFDGTDDYASSADATLLGWGNVAVHGATIFLVGLVNANPSATAHVAGWRAGGNKVAINSNTARLTRPQKVATTANGAASPNFTAQASWIIAVESGAEGDVLVYCNGALHQTLAVTGVSPGAMTEFSFGALVGGTGASALALKAAAVMPTVATSDERAAWEAWVTAGCPL